MRTLSVIALLVGFLSFATCEAADPFLTIEGQEHIVFATGEEYYRSEEGMSMFAKIMARHHGFKCTVLFAIDPSTGLINPNRNNNIPGLAALETADLMVIFARFRELPDANMKHIVDYVNAGKPVLGIVMIAHDQLLRVPPQSVVIPSITGQEFRQRSRPDPAHQRDWLSALARQPAELPPHRLGQFPARLTPPKTIRELVQELTQRRPPILHLIDGHP